MRCLRFWLFLLVTGLTPGVSSAQYIETEVRVGFAPSDLFWNPISNKVYCANSGENSVSIIDGATNVVRATIGVADFPANFCLNPNANKVYCFCPEDGIVEVFDGWGDSIMARIRLGDYPHAGAFSVTSNKLYVARSDIGTLTVLDGWSDSVIRHIRIARDEIRGLLWHPANNRLFAAGDSVTIVDCEADRVAAGMHVTNTFQDWCVNPVSGLVYMGGTRGIHVFSAAGDSLAAAVPGHVSWLCPVPFPNKMYLYAYSTQMRVLDCASHVILDTIAIYGGPLVCDTARGKVYSSYCGLPQQMVTVFDARTDTVLKVIQCSGSLGVLCWNPVDSRVYVADEQSDRVIVLRDTTTGVAEAEVPRGSRLASSSSVVRRLFSWPASQTGCVIDASGRMVAEARHAVNDFSHLPAGVYVVVSADGSATTRFLKLR